MDNLFLISVQFIQLKYLWKWTSWICFKLDLVFEHFSYWVLDNEAFENFFAMSAKEYWGGCSENSGKNSLSQTRCICGWPLIMWKQAILEHDKW